jgi:hypothetical protein
LFAVSGELCKLNAKPESSLLTGKNVVPDFALRLDDDLGMGVIARVDQEIGGDRFWGGDIAMAND